MIKYNETKLSLKRKYVRPSNKGKPQAITSISYSDFVAPIVGNNKPERKVVEKLVAAILCGWVKMDEYFIKSCAGPSCPQVDWYMKSLATLVNSEIESAGEIEDINKLEILAFDGIPNRTRTLDSVKSDCRDFSEYFKFLLNRDEKIVFNNIELDKARSIVGKIKDAGFRVKNPDLFCKVDVNSDGIPPGYGQKFDVTGIDVDLIADGNAILVLDTSTKNLSLAIHDSLTDVKSYILMGAFNVILIVYTETSATVNSVITYIDQCNARFKECLSYMNGASHVTI